MPFTEQVNTQAWAATRATYLSLVCCLNLRTQLSYGQDRIDQSLKQAETSCCSGEELSWLCILELVDEEVVTRTNSVLSPGLWISSLSLHS